MPTSLQAHRGADDAERMRRWVSLLRLISDAEFGQLVGQIAARQAERARGFGLRSRAGG